MASKPMLFVVHVRLAATPHRSLDEALSLPRRSLSRCAERGNQPGHGNLGGGFPTKYLKTCRRWWSYALDLPRFAQALGNRIPESIIEPAAAWSAMPA